MKLIKDELYVTPRGELMKYQYEWYFKFIAHLKMTMYSDNTTPYTNIYYMGAISELITYNEYKIRQQVKDWLNEK